MSKPSHSQGKLQLIQGSRGVAALLVLLFHATELSDQKFNYSFLSGLFGFGDAGVDFFFVLSGFIIFWVHRRDMGQPKALRPFLLKRLIRIYPLYWAITLAVLPVYFLIPTFGKGFERDPGVILKSLLLYPQAHPPIVNVGWTLCHEVFFYLVFALAIALSPRLSKPIVLAWIAATTLIFMAGLLGNFSLETSPFWELVFDWHNLEFILGCLAAYLVFNHTIRWSKFLVISGTALFLLFGVANHYQMSSINGIFAYGIPSAMIIIGAASIDRNQPIQVPSLFDRLGDASYSIYLTHYISFSVLFKLAFALNLVGGLGYAGSIWLFVVIAIVIGYLIHISIEQPTLLFLRQKLLHQNAHAINRDASDSAPQMNQASAYDCKKSH